MCTDVQPGASILKKPEDWPTDSEKRLFISPPKVRPESVQRKAVCAVACCKPPYPPGTSLHRIPKKPELRKSWIVACKRQDKFNVENARVCSRHFTTDDFEEDEKSKIFESKIRMKLKKTAIPSVKLHPSEGMKKRSSRTFRYKRRQEQSKAQEEDLPPADEDLDVTNDPSVEESPEQKIASLEQLLQKKSDTIASLKGKVRRLQQTNWRLKKKLRDAAPMTTQKAKLQFAQEVLLNKFHWSKQQVDFLLSDKTRGRWASDDIVLGLTIRALSRRAYQFLRRKKLLPLPALATLRKHVKNFRCLPGVQNDVLKGK